MQAAKSMYCRECGYNLHGLPVECCPECGRGFDALDGRSFRRRAPRPIRRWMIRAGGAMGICLLALMSAWLLFYLQWRHEQPAIAFLRSKECVIESSPAGPAWLRNATLSRMRFIYDRAQTADLHGTPMTDPDLWAVRKLPRLKIMFSFSMHDGWGSFCHQRATLA